ncbi:MAG TPA: nucleoside-diphosphate sugar epimerase/dehydratase [Polyangia bacterium]|nr:nucleoside-diphosphate sugar epimerase/dehydratase [Polyangia bacterium]
MLNRSLFLRSAQIAIDLAILTFSLWLALILRFEGAAPMQMIKRVLFLWPYIVGFQYVLLAVLGIPRFSWRHIGLREAVRIFRALTAAALVLTAARMLAVNLMPHSLYIQYAHLPLGIVLIDFVLAFLGLCGVRASRRLFTERAQAQRLRASSVRQVPTLLVGAGHGGLLIAKEIERGAGLGILPVGFIDDNPQSHGSLIHGIRVLGGMVDIGRIAREHQAEQAIITIASAAGPVVRNIAEACQSAGLKVKIIPGLHQLVGGDVNFTRIRDVAIEDLLRRDAVVLDDQAIAADLRDSVVMVTGAGGSIGSEICRQVARFGPARLLLVERAENALFEIHRELREALPDLNCVPLVADIADSRRMKQVFQEFRPQIVFHAAAHKHVPMMEWNAAEAIKNNVIGTRTLADIAHASQTRAFVMISTDKAVNPTSVMGASKRAAEMYIQALGKQSPTRFVTVRFGNVLGSNGSVVPIFKEQISRGGPVTVTHPDMKRYFMTIPEACQLVLQAGAMGSGGEIFILDMGEPVRIVELARDLIRLSGFQPDEIEIVFTGTRPGEKLYEELVITGEQTEKTRHPKIFIGRTVAEPLEIVAAKLDQLRSAADQADRGEAVRAILMTVVPEFHLDEAGRDARVPEGTGFTESSRRRTGSEKAATLEPSR